MAKSISDNCYDYPQYWDLAFRDETELEANFFEQAFAKYATRPVRRLLEPGCGGGRLIVEMASRGYEVTGFDLSEPSIRYLKRRLQRRGLRGVATVGDMTAFETAHPYDAVFNTFNTFRHLLDEKAASSHLRCVASALAPGGLFILGMHVIPHDAADESIERWTARHAGVKVTVTMRVVETNWSQRIEKLRYNLHVRRDDKVKRLHTEFPLRLYRPEHLEALLARESRLEICDVFDFWYQIDHPLTLRDDVADVVVVLRKRQG